jgi:Ca2+-binding EF-hand superfamily protein
VLAAFLLQYDLDDNGKLDSNEFVKMVATLGADVSRTEAEAALEVSQLA